MVHWCRKVMNDVTFAEVSRLPTPTMNALEISGDYWGKMCQFKTYDTVHYPAFDLIYDIIAPEAFDIIFAEQVLEHVKYPYRAIRNVLRMLKPNGWFLVTTPFLIQIHSDWDYTRWTATGLRYFLEECGFPYDKIKIGQWGNRDCVISDFNSCAEGRGWADYVEGQHSLSDEYCYPASVWALAQKAWP